jgi:hypothetical protein
MTQLEKERVWLSLDNSCMVPIQLSPLTWRKLCRFVNPCGLSCNWRNQAITLTENRRAIVSVIDSMTMSAPAGE